MLHSGEHGGKSSTPLTLCSSVLTTTESKKMMVYLQRWSLLKGIRFKASINELSKKEDHMHDTSSGERNQGVDLSG